MREEYARAGFDPARIEVIHNGIAPRFFEAAPERIMRADEHVGPLRLLFVGRLCPEKGVLTALKAMALLGDVDCHLDIIGDGDPAYQRALRAYAHDQRLAEQALFHGAMPQEQLIAWYDRDDVLLNTSLWAEPFGLATVEAMARGMAVIGSRTGGTAEIITPGVNGLLTEPGDEHALAAAIRQLAANPARRARLAAAARRTAAERFTLEENVRRVARHLQRATRGDMTHATDSATTTNVYSAPGGAREAVG